MPKKRKNISSGTITISSDKFEFSRQIKSELRPFKTAQRTLDFHNQTLSELDSFRAIEDQKAFSKNLRTKLSALEKRYGKYVVLYDFANRIDDPEYYRLNFHKLESTLQNLAREETRSFHTAYKSSFLPKAIEGLRKGYELPDGALRIFVTATLGGRTPPSQAKLVLHKLADRLPTEKELVGAARSMRAAMVKIKNHTDAFDVVGTGGDGHHTFNISTATALVVAAQGVKVAKHGNRSASSMSGAADVLEALGVKVDISSKRAAQALDEIGLAFLFAQTFHPALRRVGKIRKEIGRRTIFNLLGPLSNPAQVKNIVLGVYEEPLMDTMAKALHAFGASNVWVVHGHDGMDEITTTGATKISRLANGKIEHDEIVPEDFGLKRRKIDELRGGTAQSNADAIIDLLNGEKGAFRDIVLLNSAVSLLVAGKVNDIKTGIEGAKEALDSGKALKLLRRLVVFTKEP